MSTFTPALTADWVADDDNKFGAYQISSEALAMINKSETLKSDMRAYASSDYTSRGLVHGLAGAGEYQPPTGKDSPGFLRIAQDRLATPEGAVSILAHELGHFRVEEPNAAIANARVSAMAARDKTAYEAACHATEGYAHYNEVKVREEILDTLRLSAQLEQRPLTRDELQLEARWRGEGPHGSRGEGKDYLIAQGISDAALQEPGHMTATQVMETAVFALAQNNKANLTSITTQTYAEYCSTGAAKMTAPGGALSGEPQRLDRSPWEAEMQPSRSRPAENLSLFLDQMLAADDRTFRTIQQALASLPPGQSIIAEGISEINRQEQLDKENRQMPTQQQTLPEAPALVRSR